MLRNALTSIIIYMHNTCYGLSFKLSIKNLEKNRRTKLVTNTKPLFDKNAINHTELSCFILYILFICQSLTTYNITTTFSLFTR